MTRQRGFERGARGAVGAGRGARGRGRGGAGRQLVIGIHNHTTGTDGTRTETGDGDGGGGGRRSADPRRIRPVRPHSSTSSHSPQAGSRPTVEMNVRTASRNVYDAVRGAALVQSAVAHVLTAEANDVGRWYTRDTPTASTSIEEASEQTGRKTEAWSTSRT